MIASSAAVVDWIVRVGVLDESDVARHGEIVTAAMIVTAAAATKAMTGQPGRWFRLLSGKPAERLSRALK